MTPVFRSVTPRNVEMGQSLHSGRSMSFIRKSCTTQSCKYKGGDEAKNAVVGVSKDSKQEEQTLGLSQPRSECLVHI